LGETAGDRGLGRFCKAPTHTRTDELSRNGHFALFAQSRGRSYLIGGGDSSRALHYSSWLRNVRGCVQHTPTPTVVTERAAAVDAATHHHEVAF
jgi:hypothetical protein